MEGVLKNNNIIRTKKEMPKQHIRPTYGNIQEERVNILLGNDKNQLNLNVDMNSNEIDNVEMAYEVDPSIHTFYYAWYGNPESNEHWLHWNHKVLPDWHVKGLFYTV